MSLAPDMFSRRLTLATILWMISSSHYCGQSSSRRSLQALDQIVLTFDASILAGAAAAAPKVLAGTMWLKTRTTCLFAIFGSILEVQALAIPACKFGA